MITQSLSRRADTSFNLEPQARYLRQTLRTAAEARPQLQREVTEREREVDLARRQLAIVARDIQQTLDASQPVRREQFRGLMEAARCHATETGTHLVQISSLSGAVARRLQLPEFEVRRIEVAAVLHDVGKLCVPDTILKKPGALTDDEWILMKEHTTRGASMLRASKLPVLQLGYDIALRHHESWDGSGYPHGARGEQIPLAARIVKLCDQYDALRSPRAYKPSYDHETTLQIMTEGDGRTLPQHFDPELLAIFKVAHRQLESIWQSTEEQEDGAAHRAAVCCA